MRSARNESDSSKRRDGEVAGGHRADADREPVRDGARRRAAAAGGGAAARGRDGDADERGDRRRRGRDGRRSEGASAPSATPPRAERDRRAARACSRRRRRARAARRSRPRRRWRTRSRSGESSSAATHGAALRGTGGVGGEPLADRRRGSRRTGRTRARRWASSSRRSRAASPGLAPPVPIAIWSSPRSTTAGAMKVAGLRHVDDVQQHALPLRLRRAAAATSVGVPRRRVGEERRPARSPRR